MGVIVLILVVVLDSRHSLARTTTRTSRRRGRLTGLLVDFSFDFRGPEE
jgi:hypothetical protein